MKFKGLSDAEVTASRQANGDNTIPEAEPTTFLEAFKETFSDPMIRILIAIVVIMLILFVIGYAKIYEPIGTIIAIVLVAFFSAKTSVASDTKYRELKHRQKKDTCKCIRNGAIAVCEIDDVVVGDKILLQAGDRIPADGILVDGKLSIDNSVLNGETDECIKQASPEAKLPTEVTGDTLVDACSLFRGTTIYDGNGVLDVQAVGIKTMMGGMAQEMNADTVDSPLKVKLSKLAKQISTFGYVGAIVIAIFYIGYFIVTAGGFGAYFGHTLPSIIKDIVEAVSLAIVIVVCAVPEGLPLMISIVLMQNTSRMLDHNVLVRKAIGIETAGSLNILFSDKTGTITKGELEVVSFLTADGRELTGENFGKYGELKSLFNTAVCKNTASMFDSEHKVIGGNATDQALLKFVGEEDFNYYQNAIEYTVGNSQDFNSANKFSQVYIAPLHRTYYKGAPEKLLACAKQAVDSRGNVIELDTEAVSEMINKLANKAMRVIAFGCSESEMVPNSINSDIIIIGFVAIRDDVRPDAVQAIKAVQNAGIQVVMLTGDRFETAVAIAKDAGLIREDSDKALTSAELADMTDAEIAEMLPDIRVIARALPTDKSRMVRICQEQNLVVGMTGDGVNDSPALKKADVGFAMGSGTEAAKEAGEIVILDDNFRSIKDAILYGRTIYHNILKFCKFQLVINVAAVVVSAIAPLLGVNEPLKVTHLLFINLVMDGLGAIMLGNEPAREEYMSEKPRRRNENLVSRDMMMQIGITGGWIILLSIAFLLMPLFDLAFSGSIQKLTAYFVLFVLCALFNGFNVRDDGFAIFEGLDENKDFMRVFLAIAGVLFLIVNIGVIPLAPFHWIGDMFSVVPIGMTGWAVVILLAMTTVPIDLIRKTLTNEELSLSNFVINFFGR